MRRKPSPGGPRRADVLTGRGQALAAVLERLRLACQDLNTVTDDQAMRDAADLAAASDLTRDVDAARALAQFHWLRYLIPPEHHRRQELAAVTRLLGLIGAEAQAVPGLLRLWYQQANRLGDVSQDPDAATDLAIAMTAAYELSGQLPILREATELFRAAMSATPTDDPEYAAVLSNLGASLTTLAERTGEVPGLQAAADTGRAAVAATPAGHPRRPGRLSNLAVILQRLFERTGQLAVLTEAADAARSAVDSTPPDQPAQAVYLANLAAILGTLTAQTGDDAAPAEAVRLGRAAVRLCPADHPDHAAYLSNLASALQRMFDRSGDTAVLIEAAQMARAAVEATPDGHVDLAGYLSNLGNTLRTLAEHSQDDSALVAAVEAGRAAVAAVPPGHADRAIYLTNLGGALHRLFERTGNTAVLAEAVETTRAAVTATPAGHPSAAGRMSNLAAALQRLFERTAEAVVLAESVETGRAAVALAPVTHPARAMYLSNLGNTLRTLYDRTGETTALMEATEASRAAATATPADPANRAGHWSNLGNTLRTLFRRTGDTAVLAEAVEAGRKAIRITPADHPDRAMYLSNLASSLRLLSEDTGNEATLAEALKVMRSAVRASPASHPDRPMYLSNLGSTLRALFERTGDDPVLAEAIEAGRFAADGTPADHPDRAAVLYNLGITLQALFEHSDDRTVIAETEHCFAQAAEQESAPAWVRIAAYHSMSRLVLRSGGSAQTSLTAAENAVLLLPQVSSRALSRADREYGLGRLASLPGDVAAAAIAAGQPERAAELLEQTRGVLVADAIGAASGDVTLLRDIAPQHAAALDALRDRIDALAWVDASSARSSADRPRHSMNHETGLDVAAARRDAHAEWEALVQRIRAIEGLGDFLRPPGIKSLTTQARDGPIAFVYVSPSRCDALIINDGSGPPVSVVPLANITEEEAHRQASRILRAGHPAPDDPRARMAAHREILDVLAWTWDTITEPVLSALGHSTTPGYQDTWPHVWWCPVGILAYLPLHAAGHHDDLTSTDPVLRAHPRAVPDRVVSSYAITVRALAHGRARPATSSQAILIIAVPDAPGTESLPGVATEVTALTDLLPNAHTLPHATRASVLAALPDYDLAHFACHGIADLANPSGSELILYDHRTEPLMIADIIRLRLPGASLAYLSACDTSITSAKLANEAVHITGAFHLAGYGNVVGTLWPVIDTAASKITLQFYGHISRMGTSTPDADLAASALHQATRDLRNRHPRSPALWATHVHIGG